MRPPITDIRQLQLFHEIVENVASGPDPFVDDWSDVSWGARLVRPPGKGWHVSGFDVRTRWTRRTPIVVPQKTGRGGWRRR